MSFKLTPLQQRTLQVAKRHLGEHEATGHNDGKLPSFVQRWVAKGQAWLDRQPWCACFATWAIHSAANELRREGVAVDGPRIPPCASSSSLYRWFQANHWLSKPLPGRVGLVRGGSTGHSHTFLIHDIVRPTVSGQLSVLGGSLDPSAVLPTDRVIGVDGNYHNAVSWSRRRVADVDAGTIC